MLRIDPAVRPLWRSPDAVQFGDDPVLAVLDPVPPGADPLLTALVSGVERRRLHRIAAESGVTRAVVQRLLDALAPVLAGGSEPLPPALAVGLDAPPDLAAMLGGLLHLDPATSAPDLVLVAGHHLIAPAATVRHLLADVPHLGVVFGDQAVVVGPFVRPGATPCLRCAEEHRLEEPGRRAVGAQLLRRSSSRTAASVPVRLRAALLVAEVLSRVRAGAPTGLEGRAVRLTPDGVVSPAPRPWHARCSCRADGPPA